MKRVDLWGCTTAEKLIALEDAINQIGDAIPINIGAWDSNTVYSLGNTVQYDGETYISIKDENSNHIPNEESSQWWNVFAAKGDVGERGDDGSDGRPAFITTTTITIENPSVGSIWFTDYSNISPIGIEIGDSTFSICTASNGDTYAAICKVGSLSAGSVGGQIAAIQKITGPKGDAGAAGNNIYCHYISFQPAYTGSGDQGLAALILVNRSSAPISSETDLCKAINSMPRGTYIPITIEAEVTAGTGGTSDNRAAFVVCKGNGSTDGIEITSGLGLASPARTDTISASALYGLKDYVI